MIRLAVVLLMIVIAPGAVWSQPYDYQAGLERPDTTGYHLIHLTPEVSGLMRRNLGDLRIYTDEGREVPYYTSKEVISTHYAHFKEYPIYDVDRHRGWDYYSRHYVKNTSNKPIRQLILKIANFEDTRYVRLSGSNDGKTWFVVKHSYVFHDIVSEDEAYAYKVLRFPLSDYKYFKIEVDDYHWGHDHVNIQAVGYFDEVIEKGEYTRVPTPSFHQMDTMAKHTEVFINLRKEHLSDKIRVKVNNDGHYHRRAELFKKVWTNDTTWHWNSERTFWLSSTTLNEMNFHHFKAKELKLVVYNKDDYPLDIEEVAFLQLNNYLTALLEKDQGYQLAFGNDTLPAPEYDITYFKQEIGSDLPRVQPVGEIAELVKPIVQEVQEAEDPVPFYEDRSFIWIILGAVVVLFGYMSIRMMSDVRKRESPSAHEASVDDVEVPPGHDA